VDPRVPEPVSCPVSATSHLPCARNPLAVAHLAGLGAGLVSIGPYVVVPAGAIVVLVSVLRRFHRLPLAVRRLAVPALLAGCFAAVGDVLLNLTDVFGPSANSNLIDIVGPRSGFGGLIGLFDTGRYVTVPVILVWAAWRSRRRLEHMDEVRTVEVGRAVTPLGLRDSIAVALDDPAALVGFRRGDSGWVDARGDPVSLGHAGRTMTMIERDGEPIAAIEHHGSRDDRAMTLDAAVAAAGATIDYERLSALARSRQAEALQARRAIIEVEDAARRRLERDLHDGAQQRLVGLALHASLAERAGGQDGIEALLAEGVPTARAELRSLLEGLPPAMLAERGLEVALCTLAATAPLEVDIDVNVPAGLPARATTTAWFVVAEAVANAIKHANARRLRVIGGVDGSRLRVAVADDGMGGADETAGSGLIGLRARANSLGGSLAVDSAPGAGTTVRLDIPVGADP
jgi:signal transduction histidine kinase